MKLYFKSLFLIAITVIVLGFAGPNLISSDSTELVVIGIGIILGVLVPVWATVGNKIIKNIKRRIENEKTHP